MKRIIDRFHLLLGWLINLIFPFPMDEYMERFVVPHIDRARELGIPAEVVERLWHDAVNESDINVVELTPAALFADKIDAWVALREMEAN